MELQLLQLLHDPTFINSVQEVVILFDVGLQFFELLADSHDELQGLQHSLQQVHVRLIPNNLNVKLHDVNTLEKSID